MIASDLPLNKAPLGETGCLSNPYLLLTGYLDIQFFDSPLTQSKGLDMGAYHSLCFPTNPFPGKQSIFLGLESMES